MCTASELHSVLYSHRSWVLWWRVVGDYHDLRWNAFLAGDGLVLFLGEGLARLGGGDRFLRMGEGGGERLRGGGVRILGGDARLLGGLLLIGEGVRL